MANCVKVVDYPSTTFLARNVLKHTDKHDGRAELFAVMELFVKQRLVENLGSYASHYGRPTF